MAHTQWGWSSAADRGRRGLWEALAMVAGGVVLLTLVVFASPASTLQGHASRSPRPAPSATAMRGPDTRRDSRPDTRPNIVVIYTDDMRAGDLDVMPTVTEQMVEQGAVFRNSIVTTSACCPARATHLTGQYAHNTGVLHNAPPFGGYPAFKRGRQKAGATLPIWMRNSGYRTVFFGKFMNHYPVPDDKYQIPSGFTDWYGLYEGTVRGAPLSIYRQTRYAVRVRPQDQDPSLLDAALARAVARAPDDNGHIFIYDGQDRHQTEVLMDGAIKAVDRYGGTDPLYLNVWLTAAHTGGDGPIVGGGDYPTRLRSYTVRPAPPELQKLKAQLRSGGGLGPFGMDRPPSFNERDVADKPAFVRTAPRLRPRDVQDIEIRNALRVAALQSVDRKIAELLVAIERAEQRTGRETYVIFSSDGGYFLGEHRLPFEKNWHYGAASDVPLVVRGPGVARDVEIAAPVANIDLASTILEMAGEQADAGEHGDGRSLMPLLADPADAETDPSWKDRALLLEGFWGRTNRPRYNAVRTRTHVYVEHYAHDDGRTVEFRELFDLTDDPYYQDNLLHGNVSAQAQAQGTARRLQGTLELLKACSGTQCRQTATAFERGRPRSRTDPAGVSPRSPASDPHATRPAQSPPHDRRSRTGSGSAAGSAVAR